ncbi:TIGR02217 family protein [Jiella endophytica]|uniref:TIGR02217 family protein n=1 Tax=Jiella endophytica TaxID=2558362 RepID=A0A4Y8RE37_9HYPH|nr:DUF2460 domain-containing protein [Jiella endophytica]TFF20566.1 TIGR02217 family protein [Jiella endophytica]
MAIEAFSEERFPLRIAFGTSGGPERRTDIVRLSTGFEARNQRQARSMRRYDAGSGLKSLADLAAVLEFFEAMRGRLTAFRFRDPLDHASARLGQPITPLDQRIGTGDGETREFPLAKLYGSGEGAYRRPIEKPVAGSVRIAIAGAETVASVDATTGLVGFEVAPALGAAITAGFEFDVPVRFDTDQIAINIAAFEAGDIPTIPLIEVRP